MVREVHTSPDGPRDLYYEDTSKFFAEIRGYSVCGASSRQEAPGEEIIALRGIDPLPPLTVYLPYMSWMKYGDYLLTKDPHKQLTREGYAERQRYYLADFGTPQAVDGSRSWPMMTSPEVIANQKYPRRTLDQFYYPALHDTSVRDKDQTVSKWTGAALGLDGKEEAGTDSLLIMIDQFWCWIINKNTILTSFPSGSYSAPPTDVQDLYQSIIESLARDPKEMKSVADMYLFLTRKVVGYMFSQANRNLVDLVEIYRWVTSKKAATQTSYFQEFQQGYASGGDDNTIFNDRRDLKLVLDVADIIDELKMIEHLFSIQKEIIESSVKALGMDYLVSLNLMKETVDLLIHQITSISKDAEHTRKMLLNLLDLKSNAASLAEARSSAKEAQAATTQGRAVMLFTIITVVFLPLSFFTSYFGQNVKELTGDENNPTSWDLWRVATPITVVVIVVALLVAFYITRPKSPLWFWQAAPKQGAAVEQETMATGTKRVKWWQRRPSFTFLNSKREKGKNGDPELTVV
ncbi:unnamed protein product [Alternaria alternata]